MQTTILKKYFFKRMNNAAVAKAMENSRHQAYDNQKRRSKLVLEQNHKTTKWFSQNLVLTEKKNIKK